MKARSVRDAHACVVHDRHVLALPAAFAESGVAIGLVLILASAGFNIWSCMLLVHSSALSRRFSYRSIGVPRSAALDEVREGAVVLVLFGIITWLLAVLRTASRVMQLFTPEPASRWMLSGIVVLVLILLLSLPLSIAALKYTNAHVGVHLLRYLHCCGLWCQLHTRDG